MSLEIIQIIEDEPLHAKLLDHALRQAQYRTNLAFDGETGLRDVKRLHPALVILDVMLPGPSGHAICRELRCDPATQHIPIIMLTALGTEEDRVGGLEMGADDYMTKPFSPREVVAHVRSLLRRARPGYSLRKATPDGSLMLDEQSFMVTWHGRQLTLSSQEWTILCSLATRTGQVIVREELESLLWGEGPLLHDRKLDQHVKGLGQKLSANVAGSIETVSGIGYRLLPPKP